MAYSHSYREIFDDDFRHFKNRILFKEELKKNHSNIYFIIENND